MLKVNDTVECLIGLNPLKKGDTGIVTEINSNAYPVIVQFTSISHYAIMKHNEIKKVK